MRILIIFLIFFVMGALFIVDNHDIALYREGNFGKFAGLYTSWITQLFENSKLITGEAMKLVWFPNTNESTE